MLAQLHYPRTESHPYSVLPCTTDVVQTMRRPAPKASPAAASPPGGAPPVAAASLAGRLGRPSMQRAQRCRARVQRCFLCWHSCTAMLPARSSVRKRGWGEVRLVSGWLAGLLDCRL